MDSFISEQAATFDVAPLPPRDVLLSVRTGKIRPLGGLNIRSGINKNARQGRVRVTESGLVGDEVQYVLHGGPDKALHMYCASHYETWNEEVPNREHLFKIGGFGENLSTALLSESNVCIGDRFRLGLEVIVQVSEPRQPCFKLNHRFEYKKASSAAQDSGRTGWYLRVLKPGYIQEGDAFELIDRINPQWSIAQVLKYMYHDVNNREAWLKLSQLPALGNETVEVFRSRLAKGTEDMTGRLEGDRIPMVWRSYKLLEKIGLTPRIKKFIFEVDDSSADIETMEFGRFPHVRMQFGPDFSFSRAYSVVAGDMRRFELGIARDDNSRGGSVFLHDDIQVGDIIRGAKGRDAKVPSQSDCIDNPQNKKHIFIIGGVGVTAFMREIAMLSQSSADFEVHYAVRSRSEAAYLDHLPSKNTRIYAANEGKRLDLRSVVPEPQDQEKIDTKIYCCGPPSLLASCQDLTTKRRYPRSNVHFEEFGGLTTGTGEPFEAEIKATGLILQVPRGKSLLQVLNEAGFEIESSCQVGNCGTCMVDYCKGKVEHRGIALQDEQKNESMLSCVSRGEGRIVVDC
ncbi:pyruvate kinase-like protein [Xylariales sp. AK1849]|nr:pyruvate kinase-like protein [Xylariales sp. AK1849]